MDGISLFRPRESNQAALMAFACVLEKKCSNRSVLAAILAVFQKFVFDISRLVDVGSNRCFLQIVRLGNTRKLYEDPNSLRGQTAALEQKNVFKNAEKRRVITHGFWRKKVPKKLKVPQMRNKWMELVCFGHASRTRLHLWPLHAF